MSDWTAADLDQIGSVTELEITTQQAEPPRAPRPPPSGS